MKIRTLTAVTLLALFASTSASAGRLVVNTTNNSTDAIAVGGSTLSTYSLFGFSGVDLELGGRALAGSVSVNADGVGCGCDRVITVKNDSSGAIAIGQASAGSTMINL